MNKKLLYLSILLIGFSASAIYGTGSIVTDTDISTPLVNSADIVNSNSISTKDLTVTGTCTGCGSGSSSQLDTQTITYTNETNMTIDTDNSNPKIIAKWKIHFNQTQNVFPIHTQTLLKFWVHKISNAHNGEVDVSDSIDDSNYSALNIGFFSSSDNDLFETDGGAGNFFSHFSVNQDYYLRISGQIGVQGVDSVQIDHLELVETIFGIGNATITKLVG